MFLGIVVLESHGHVVTLRLHSHVLMANDSSAFADRILCSFWCSLDSSPRIVMNRLLSWASIKMVLVRGSWSIISVNQKYRAGWLSLFIDVLDSFVLAVYSRLPLLWRIAWLNFAAYVAWSLVWRTSSIWHMSTTASRTVLRVWGLRLWWMAIVVGAATTWHLPHSKTILIKDWLRWLSRWRWTSTLITRVMVVTTTLMATKTIKGIFSIVVTLLWLDAFAVRFFTVRLGIGTSKFFCRPQLDFPLWIQCLKRLVDLDSKFSLTNNYANLALVEGLLRISVLLVDDEGEATRPITGVKRHVYVFNAAELIESAEQALTCLRELDVVDENFRESFHALMTSWVRRLFFAHFIAEPW